MNPSLPERVNCWLSYAPSKVVVLSWQMLLGHQPTRANLYKRGVSGRGEEPSCVWSPRQRESEEHMFVNLLWIFGMGFSSVLE